MKRFLLAGVIGVLFIGSSCFAQDLPSKDEINELAAKANEKVVLFERALEAARGFVGGEEAFKKYTKAASTAHALIRAVQNNGPSAYGLVGLVMTLDDLVFDAREIETNALITTVRFQSTGRNVPASIEQSTALASETLSAVNRLENAARGCLDISELIGHAALRLIAAEEDAIHQIAK